MICKGRVVIVTFEDDETEWHRRIAAACDHYELDYEFVMANVHFLRKPGGRVSFASPARDAIAFPDSKDIIKKVFGTSHEHEIKRLRSRVAASTISSRRGASAGRASRRWGCWW